MQHEIVMDAIEKALKDIFTVKVLITDKPTHAKRNAVSESGLNTILISR